MNNRWNHAGALEEIVWNMRLAEQPRADARVLYNRLYNGDPPFDPAKAIADDVQINRNNLQGANLMAQARRQWNQAMIGPGNFFTCTLDSGDKIKRREYSHTITKHANKVLKRSRKYLEQQRATGGNAMLHGIAPSLWDTRRGVVCDPLLVGSVLVPSETDITLENLQYFAVFREWTPAQLMEMTHGTKTDPGWNMPLVQSQYRYIRDQVVKQTNIASYQYMPEKIEELLKGDKTFAGSDAVPTCDVWDCYCRRDDGKGWVRRIILDWFSGQSVSEEGGRPKRTSMRHPSQKNTDDGNFLYTSQDRIYAKDLSEIIHWQFADTSPVFPQKYQCVRSLGWLAWGPCDLDNRMYCKFAEAAYEQMQWYFEVANNEQLTRLKKANFLHMGVIPAGIKWIKDTERFKPDGAMVQQFFEMNKQLLNQSASSFVQDFGRGESGKEKTATEVMAQVNSVNALVSGMLTLAYTYEEFKDREIMRRLCIKNNPDPMARKFRQLCLQDGIPSELLDAERMDIARERVLGGGNKTLEMAQVQFLQSVRKNLNPDAQREVDHLAIESTTDDAALAERLAPTGQQQHVTNSQHDAELSFDRLMRGLPYMAPREAVPEDYVSVWMRDAANVVQQIQQRDNVGTPEELLGLGNVLANVEQYLQGMATNDEEKPKVRQYSDLIKHLGNLIKGFGQRQQQMRGQPGENGNGKMSETMEKIRGQQMLNQQKLQNTATSHAMKTAQRQVQFQLDQQREDQRTAADIRREDARTAQDLAGQQMKNRLKAFSE